ncbi:hypothetical protein [Sphingomonas sp. AAP5]|uniref:hypothetical protein n=1 Tax=Sphingomonas sp. AAP5 TaxID=1523415 RepID=UPI0019D154C6|nr:hypothetical protein [Sphingomonas sp. AAP5]
MIRQIEAMLNTVGATRKRRGISCSAARAQLGTSVTNQQCDIPMTSLVADPSDLFVAAINKQPAFPALWYFLNPAIRSMSDLGSGVGSKRLSAELRTMMGSRWSIQIGGEWTLVDFRLRVFMPGSRLPHLPTQAF